MRAIDTNVLVRLPTRDDAEQVERAEAFVAGGAWVSLLVLAEAAWVLQSAYQVDDARLGTVVAMLLQHEQLVLRDADVVEKALIRFRTDPGPSFPDHLILEIASKAGHAPLGTFDRALGRTAGAEALGTKRRKG